MPFVARMERSAMRDFESNPGFRFASSGLQPDPILKPQARDVADLSQRGGKFCLRIIADALLEGREDGFGGRVPPHAHDEGKAKFLRIGGIGAREAREVPIAQLVEPQPALFGLGVGGHRAGAMTDRKRTRLTSSYRAS